MKSPEGEKARERLWTGNSLVRWHLSKFLRSSQFSRRDSWIPPASGPPAGALFYTLGAGGAVRPDYHQATPWDDPDYYRVTFPLSYVKRARTPTFPGTGHVPNTQGQIRAIMEQNLDWFEHWLLAQP